MGDFWKQTAQLYTGFIQRPKMTEKLLQKPPFKYLFDIITETTKKTGFASGLYVGDELKSDYYSQKDRKITYLTKIITLAEMMDGNKIPAKPQKIIAGLEPEFTNAMLQSIHRCATSGQPSDPYVKKILSGGGSQQAEVKQQGKKKIDRPPSAAKIKKDPPTKKTVEKIEEPKEEEKPIEPAVIDKPKEKHEYSKKVKDLMNEGEEEVQAEREAQIEQEKNKKDINMGRLNKKKKQGSGAKEDVVSTGGQLNEKQLELAKSMIQSICQNTAPLGKSIQFINDDIEAMNKELIFWRKQYNASKSKLQNELKVTEEALLPIYDKLGQIEEQIKDQKGKIQTAKAQILKNDSTIRDLLLSVVTTK